MKWKRAVIHPGLDEAMATRLLLERDDPAVQVTGRTGAVMNWGAYPSLKAVLPELRKRNGKTVGGTAGLRIRLDRPAVVGEDDTWTVVEGKPGKLKTTLDPAVQKAAEKATAQHNRSAAVAVDARSGEILAFANSPADGFNTAFLGKLAPGSVMKTITASMLIDKGLTTENNVVDCTKWRTWEGRQFRNLNMDSFTGRPFSTSFTRSCNTAFISFTDDISDSDLGDTARTYFGLGRDDWNTGLPSFDGGIPTVSGPEKAAALIGQGQVQVNPLNMASVVATITNGQFRQPRLIPASMDERDPATATRLPSHVASQVRDMMRLTASSETGKQAMAGVPGDTGAKTGSAEVGGQATSDSWFAAFRDNVAVAGVVQRGGHGGTAAGPVVADILKASS